MDRCALALEYHKKGFNCAQSVLAAFGDLTHLPETQALAVSGGFGGGVGGTHQELCGAVSGAAMTIGLLAPHLREGDPEGKKRLYGITKMLWDRFEQTFHHTRCGDLLASPIPVGANLPAANRLGITGHCPIMIVTAVELTESILRENGIDC